MNIKEVFTKRQNGEITFKGLMQKTIEKLQPKKVGSFFTNLVTPYMASSTKAPMNWLLLDPLLESFAAPGSSAVLSSMSVVR